MVHFRAESVVHFAPEWVVHFHRNSQYTSKTLRIDIKNSFSVCYLQLLLSFIPVMRQPHTSRSAVFPNLSRAHKVTIPANPLLQSTLNRAQATIHTDRTVMPCRNSKPSPRFPASFSRRAGRQSSDLPARKPPASATVCNASQLLGP